MLTQLSHLRKLTRNVRTSTTILLWVFSIAALGLFIASFLVPPMGEISPSVLKAGAEIFAIMALLEAREAIIEGLGVKLTHGQTTVEVKDLNGRQSDEINDNTDDHEEA